jgi:carbamoyltransferase
VFSVQDKWGNAHRRDVTYHPIFGWLYVPNQTMRVTDPTQPYYVRTNHQGFRSNFDFNKESQAKKRIIFLGDSFTAGNGVANEDRFSDLLMNSIGNLECDNFALSGSGTDQQVLIYEHIAKQFDHDLIVLGFALWDIKRLGPETPWGAKPYFSEKGGELDLCNIPVPRPTISRWQQGKNNVDKYEPYPAAKRLYELSSAIYEDLASWVRESESYFSELLLSYRSINRYGQYYNNTGQHWHLMKSIIKRLIDDSDNKTIILLPIPDVTALSSVFKDTYQTLFEQLQNEFENVIFLDIADYVKDYPRKDRHNMTSNSSGGHFTKFGNFIVSNALRQCLINNGLV